MYYDAAGTLRTNLKIPAISVGTEFGASLPVIASTSSALYLRRWPVAGTSHVSFQEMDSYIDVETLRDGFLRSPDGKAISVTQGISGCKEYPIWSKVPTELVLNAAYHHLERWIDGRSPAPATPQFERNVDGSLKSDGRGTCWEEYDYSRLRCPPVIALDSTPDQAPACYLAFTTTTLPLISKTVTIITSSMFKSSIA